LGHILENIVYLELLRRKRKVNIGKLYEKEIDFVTSDMNETEYYQVSVSVLDEKTLERELSPLQEISDNHSKILLTLDDVNSGTNHNGIKHLNVIDWLLE
jgi:predicted AAA+ superfamily ATPase